MKKTNKKHMNNYVLKVEEHFKELINAIIEYDLNDMDDMAYELVGYIEELSNDTIFELLLSDLKNRKTSDFDVYFYCKLWWALIYEQDQNIIKMIVQEVKENNNIMLHTFLIQSLKQINDVDDDEYGGENRNKLNIEDILKKINS